jgi:hypothetical protein
MDSRVSGQTCSRAAARRVKGGEKRKKKESGKRERGPYFTTIKA